MSTVAILKQLASEIATGFPSLQLWGQIYLVPTIVPTIPGMNSLEIQIALGPSNYNDQSGSILSENFQVDVAVIRRHLFDVHNLQRSALAKTTESLLVDRLTLRALLNGSYANSALTRPLLITSESAVGYSKDSIYKVLSFVGGINANWGS